MGCIRSRDLRSAVSPALPKQHRRRPQRRARAKSVQIQALVLTMRVADRIFEAEEQRRRTPPSTSAKGPDEGNSTRHIRCRPALAAVALHASARSAASKAGPSGSTRPARYGRLDPRSRSSTPHGGSAARKSPRGFSTHGLRDPGPAQAAAPTRAAASGSSWLRRLGQRSCPRGPRSRDRGAMPYAARRGRRPFVGEQLAPIRRAPHRSGKPGRSRGRPSRFARAWLRRRRSDPVVLEAGQGHLAPARRRAARAFASQMRVAASGRGPPHIAAMQRIARARARGHRR